MKGTSNSLSALSNDNEIVLILVALLFLLARFYSLFCCMCLVVLVLLAQSEDKEIDFRISFFSSGCPYFFSLSLSVFCFKSSVSWCAVMGTLIFRNSFNAYV